MSIISIVFGCSCTPKNATEAACYFNTVVKAKVVGSEVDEKHSIVTYTIGIIETLKSPIALNQTTAVVTSYGSPALCGLELQNNTSYLITGHHVNDGHDNLVFTTSLCNYYLNLDTAPAAEKVSKSNKMVGRKILIQICADY
ncbi:metalloproteinase inhibitor 2-like protein [Dinothrombium tinctorium]|uniref:Metalloproteinase inhibitor 2-like protein n=1 Tax=Dinothrombium tinctorium TaxID=1965070 RepID=A0A3S3NRL3_9ACAR|nr:metalloproteinase inhibitor 2-like protein [Dinothrombium tinctorium]RWS01586.1 metalloproteinase inhibitor 2-like protein [Dinothrombium tinctorium]RWS04666.1 metalloproteinase inhibitor 2-like protein [Dinothrombium tinctorium]